MPKSSKKYQLTGEHFYKFFQCPHWIWYDLYADESRRNDVPPLLQMIHQNGLKHETKAINGRKFEEVKPELFKDLDEAFLATVDLMRQGKNIYHGVLLDEHWVGMPDLLEARPTTHGMKSAFGDHYYVAYDIKSGSSIKEESKFQLVFYSLILERIQGVLPKEAYSINGLGDEQSFPIEDYLKEFHLTRETIEKILDGEKPAPFLKSGCKQSPWYGLCVEETQGCNDISLIYRLNQVDQRRFYEMGIRTVTQLAASNLDDLRLKLEDWPFDKILRYYNQANALVKNAPLILKKTEFPKVATEVYFDIESDPTQGIDYLLGVLVKQGNKIVYKYFLADTPGEEPKIWDEFLDFLEELNDFAIYHYSYYEREVFRRLSNKYGVSLLLSDKFQNNTIDLHRAVIDAAILPLYFYSLKDVAKYLGFNWRSENAGGAESVVWYTEWMQQHDKKILKKILEYNEDDVRATLYLKEWLEKQKPNLGNTEKLD